MRDPRRSRRSVARNPIVHGLSKREKKKKQAKCREFVECLQSTTAPRVRLHGRIPPSYPVECDCPPKPPDAAAHTRSTQRAHRLPGAGPPEDSARPSLPEPRRLPRAMSPSPLPGTRLVQPPARTRRPASPQYVFRHAAPPTVVALDAGLAVPLTFIRVQPHSDTMHPLTSALAKSRPQFDSRPQACAHPSVLPPPVAPPLVGAAPPPPAARAG